MVHVIQYEWGQQPCLPWRDLGEEEESVDLNRSKTLEASRLERLLHISGSCWAIGAVAAPILCGPPSTTADKASVVCRRGLGPSLGIALAQRLAVA